MNLPPPTSFRDIGRALWRHKKKGVACFLIVVIAANAYNAFATRLYRSEGKLFVRLGRENAALDPVATGGQGAVVAVPQVREQEINSVVEILRSRNLLERVVDTLGPEVVLGIEESAPDEGATASPDNATAKEAASRATTGDVAADDWLSKLNPFSMVSLRERAIRKLSKTLSIEAIKKSNVIAVSVTTPRPQLSQTVVAKLLDLFLQEYIEANRTANSHPFFNQQSGDLAGLVAKQEEALRELKDRTGLAAGEARKKILVERVGKLEDEQLAVGVALTAAQSEVKAIEQSLEQLPKTVPMAKTTGLSNEAHDLMRSQLYALELRQKELQARYTAEHPELIAINLQLEEAKRVFGKEERSRSSLTEGPSRIYEQAHLNEVTQKPVLAALEAKSTRLAAQVAEAKAQLTQLNADELQVRRLERELAINEANYRRYRDNMEHSRLDRELDAARISNISIFQPASYEPQPASPRRALNLALAAIGGAFLALACVLLAEMFDSSVKSPGDVQRLLEAPYLGAIPRMPPLATAKAGSEGVRL